MAENKEASAETVEAVNGAVENGADDNKEIDVDTLKKELEKTKNESKGKDKAVTDLQKKIKDYEKRIEDIELAKLSEDEKRQKQYENTIRELESLKASLTLKELNEKKINMLKKAGLSESLYTVISGNDDDSIEISINTLKEVLTEAIKRENAEKAGANSFTPKAANGKADINTEYMEAFKKGDVSTMERIKAEVNKGTS